MAENQQAQQGDQIEINRDNLYREESFTDLRVANIRRLTPIKVDGTDDPSRPVQFVAQTHVMTARGPVPIDCEIAAKDLPEAIAKFPEAVQAAVERLVQQVEQYQREAASRIVTPGDALLGGGAGGMPPPPGGQAGAGGPEIRLR